MQATRTILLKVMLSCMTYLLMGNIIVSGQRAAPGNRSDLRISEPWNARMIDSANAMKVGAGSRPGGGIKNSARYNQVNRSVLVSRPGKIDFPSSFLNKAGNDAGRPAAVCYTISGRDFLNQDSLYLYTGTPVLTADGHVIISGEYVYWDGNIQPGGFCIKADVNGNMIWARMFDSVGSTMYDGCYYFTALELKDGSIMLGGRTTNRVSGNDDVILSKLDAGGNLVWTQTYESRFWQGFNGSGDYFNNLRLYEDAAAGDLYFVGSHWGGISTITKLKGLDGSVTWSNGWKSFDSDYAFGLVVEDDRLLMMQLENGYYNDSYIDVVGISKVTGDTLFTKNIIQTGDRYAPRLYNVYGMTKLANGNYRMAGPTTGYFEFPGYTGTKDLFYAGVVELDRNLDFVRAYGFKSRLQSNSYNTKVSLFPDGTGVFTMLDVFSGYSADAHVSIFKDDLIYHQRRREHRNEGLPNEPFTLQLPDGGYLNAKVFSDSTKLYGDGCQVDFHRMHTSDTASVCLGLKDTSTSVWYFDFEPTGRRISAVHHNVFKESRVKTYTAFNFYAYSEPSCQIISNCDTVDLKVSSAVICPGTSIVLTISKNKECGSLVPITYDTGFVKRIVPLTDSTYEVFFVGEGKGYLRGSLMGCIMKEDSVFVEVLPARFSLDLGADTVVCPGNKVVLNAGRGFTAYTWQDGSVDSVFTVTAPGTYYVTALNGCGGIFSDTIEVGGHPPIPISIGEDQTKCNDDRITITATAGFMNYSWSANYNINQITGQQVVVNPAVDTFYSVIAEKTPGCFAYDTMRVKVFHSPVIDLGKDSSICFGDLLVLDAGTGFKDYEWSTGSNQQQLSVGVAGTYSVYAISPENCISRDTFRLIAVNSLPRPDLGPDSVLCAGRPRILASTGRYDTYVWSTGAGSAAISVNLPGRYWLRVTDNNGCQAADTTVIPSVQQSPFVSLGADTAICSYGTLQLKPTASYPRYLWSTGVTSPSVTISAAGTYSLQVTDANSCRGFDTIVVSLKQCLEGLYIPSAFSPNGDGVNDQFTPMLFGDVKYFDLQVYNRWGEVVFRSNRPGVTWNGNFRGGAHESTVFVWTCTYELNGQKREVRKGRVVLVR